MTIQLNLFCLHSVGILALAAMNRPVRVGIVGLMYGRYGILPGLLSNSDAQIIAVCSRDGNYAAKVAADYGIPLAFASWRQMLDSADIDLVVAAVDPVTSGDICEYALVRGMAVFAEKLPGMTLQVVRHLAEVARTGQIPVAVDYIFPELMTFRATHQTLTARAIGAPRLVQLEWVFESYDQQHGISSWKTDVSKGGGVVRHFMPHSLHYLEWLFGRTASVSATLGYASDNPADVMHAAITLESDSGLLINVTISNSAPMYSRHSLSVWGDAGYLQLVNTGLDPVQGFVLEVSSPTSREFLREAEYADFVPGIDSRVCASQRLTSALVRTLRNGENPRFPNLDDAVRVLQLIDAIEESNLKEKKIYVN